MFEFNRVSIKAVIGGLATDLAISIAGGVGIFISYLAVLMRMGSHHSSMQASPMSYWHFHLAIAMLSIISPFVGGIVAAMIARDYQYTNAFAVGILSTGCMSMTVPSYEGPPLLRILGLVVLLRIPMAIAGARLQKEMKQRKRGKRSKFRVINENECT
jgi:hypothetical protein